MPVRAPRPRPSRIWVERLTPSLLPASISPYRRVSPPRSGFSSLERQRMRQRGRACPAPRVTRCLSPYRGSRAFLARTCDHRMIVVGIDCATAPKKVGIALAECNEGRRALVAVELGESQESLARSRHRRADRPLAPSPRPEGSPTDASRSTAFHPVSDTYALKCITMTSRRTPVCNRSDRAPATTQKTPGSFGFRAFSLGAWARLRFFERYAPQEHQALNLRAICDRSGSRSCERIDGPRRRAPRRGWT
jgi:hypothetical protein